MSISSTCRATAGVRIPIGRRLGPLFGHNAMPSRGSRCTMGAGRRASPAQRSEGINETCLVSLGSRLIRTSICAYRAPSGLPCLARRVTAAAERGRRARERSSGTERPRTRDRGAGALCRSEGHPFSVDLGARGARRELGSGGPQVPAGQETRPGRPCAPPGSASRSKGRWPAARGYCAERSCPSRRPGPAVRTRRWSVAPQVAVQEGCGQPRSTGTRLASNEKNVTHVTVVTAVASGVVVASGLLGVFLWGCKGP